MSSIANKYTPTIIGEERRPMAESLLPSTQLSSFLTDPSRSAVPSNHTADESEFDDSDEAGANGSVLQKSFTQLFSRGSPNRGIPDQHTSSQRDERLNNESRSSSPTSSHHSEEFQNLSFMNDTRAQFDLAINLDDKKFSQTARSLLLWLQSNGDKRVSSIRKTPQFHGPKVPTFVESSAMQKHEDLVKQLTDCKIQLRLYDKFLQDLIDKKQIDAGDISGFHETWEERDLTVVKLRQEHEEMTTLIEDLYASLEESQQKWQQADKRAEVLHKSFEDIKDEISKLLLLAGILETLVLHHDDASYVSLAIPLLRNLVDSSVSRQRVAELETKIKVYEKEATQSERLLAQQTEEIASWQAKFDELQIQNEELQDAANTTPPRISKDVEARFAKYEAMIDDLQRQINERNDITRQTSATDIAESTHHIQKLETLRDEYAALQQSHEDMKRELKRTTESSAATIESLTRQLNNRKSEQLALRDQLALFNEVKQDLDKAVEKQRLLQSEKIKLSYQLEELKQDRIKLQGNVDLLTEKLKDTQLAEVVQDSPIADQESKINFQQLYEYDIEQLSKLGDTFDRLVDDSLINEPLEKVRTIKDFLSKSDALILEYPDDVVSDLLQCHKSLFKYFTKAADLSVDDHISLLLKKQQRAEENDRYVKKLSQRIAELEAQNDQLSRLQEEDEANLSSNDLRYQELTARWKAEREARVYENRLAKRKFRELEDEISRLREGISDTTASSRIYE